MGLAVIPKRASRRNGYRRREICCDARDERRVGGEAIKVGVG